MTLVWARRDWSPPMAPPLFPGRRSRSRGGGGCWGQVGAGSQGMGSPILTGNISLKILGLNDPDLIQPHLIRRLATMANSWLAQPAAG